ncbi:GlsB/YeaQ/YmgE family stress response membrane protein [soil metagenome]
MNWIMSLIVGALAGWIASLVMRTNDQSVWIGNVLAGVVGSQLGYWFAAIFNLDAAGGIMQFATSISGAVLLILVVANLESARKT